MLFLTTLLMAQEATVRGSVNIAQSAKDKVSNFDVVVWLTDLHKRQPAPPGPMVRLVQKDKKFTPHVLAITVGTEIEFPNQDPYFHDVFSIYHGKPFDLGLYESGTTKKLRFSEPGVSYIFCNIHPNMSAAVVALSTPYFAIASADGSFRLQRVPPGRYKFEVWFEHASQAELAAASREIEITAGDNSLPAITLHAVNTPTPHLNKYGESYSPEKSSKY
jgi:plastocyanin